MPEKGMNNYDEIWKSTDQKLISRIPYNGANDFEIPTSDEDVSPPPEDSTYNLEDDITPPEITPPEGSRSASDGTGDSVEEIQTDSSGDEQIIPKFMFQLPSETRALNIEFNRCLLLDLDPIPSTSDKLLAIKEPTTMPHWNNENRSSSTSSSSSPISLNQVCCKISENIEADDESISTDCEVSTDCSSNDNISYSLESTDSEKIIPSFLFAMFENIIIFPELELCLDFDEDSKATDNDVPDFSASAVTLDDNDYFTVDPDSMALKIWIETEITEKIIPPCNSRSSSDEIDKKFEELCNNAIPTPDSERSVTSLSLELTVIQKDDEDIIPRYLYI